MFQNRISAFACTCFLAALAVAQTLEPVLPKRVPPKRSSQIQNGFGINSDLHENPTCLGTAGGGRACTRQRELDPHWAVRE